MPDLSSLSLPGGFALPKEIDAELKDVESAAAKAPLPPPAASDLSREEEPERREVVSMEEMVEIFFLVD